MTALARAVRAAGAAVDRLGTVAMAVSALAVALMAALVTVEVLARSFASVSTLVADEMAGYLLVVLAFFGLAESLRAGVFIRVEFIDRWLRADARRRLEAVLLVVALAYTILLAWEFWRLVMQSYRFGSTSLQVSRTPLWIPQTCMAVGASILVLQLVVETLRRLTGEAPRT
jgi:TRAP-type C4-dicarboxylate transport system permease small subunit